MNIDDIIQALGVFGRYQRYMYFVICLVVLPNAWQTLIQVFAMGDTGHWCKVPGWNDTACQELGYDSASCDMIKKAIHIPLTDSDNGTLGTFQKCTRYNISDQYTMSDLSVMLSGNDTVGYSLITDSGVYDDVGIVPCDAGWEYDHSHYTRTFLQEMDLVCDDAKYVQFPQSFYYGGFLVGSVLFGVLGDRFGRQRMLFVTVVLRIVAGYALALVYNYWAFAFIRFTQGIFQIGSYIMAFVLGTEFVGISKRNVSGIFINIPYAFGYMLLAGIAYLIRDWRMLEVAVTTPLFIFFIFLIFLPESPRWLISRGETEKAKKIIRKAARINKVDLPEELLETAKEVDVHDTLPETEKRRPNFTDLFRHPNLCKRTLTLMYIWSVCAVVYHGLNLSTSSLGIDTYISFFVSAAIEIPAYITALFAVENPMFGRRRSTSFSLLLGGVACLLTMFIANGPYRAGVAFVGKFGISAAFALIYLYTIELYPTPMRAIGIGVCSMAARVANIMAPLILLTGEHWASAPLVIFGGTTVIAGFLALLLPETLGKKLPETVYEGENFMKIPTGDLDTVDLPDVNMEKSSGHLNGETKEDLSIV